MPSNATYAKNLLLLAAQRAENAAAAADGAIEELEGLLPAGNPRYHYAWDPTTQRNLATLDTPWTRETALLHGSLTGLRSARSRARKLGEELTRYAEVAEQYA